MCRWVWLVGVAGGCGWWVCPVGVAGGWDGLNLVMGAINYHFPFTGEHLWLIKHGSYFLKIWPKSDNTPNLKNCTQYVTES